MEWAGKGEGVSSTHWVPVCAEVVIIPDGVKEIPRAAFENCTILKQIAIPSSVTTIGDSAFNNCSSLKTARIARRTKIDERPDYKSFPDTCVVTRYD